MLTPPFKTSPPKSCSYLDIGGYGSGVSGYKSVLNIIVIKYYINY